MIRLCIWRPCVKAKVFFKDLNSMKMNKIYILPIAVTKWSLSSDQENRRGLSQWLGPTMFGPFGKVQFMQTIQLNYYKFTQKYINIFLKRKCVPKHRREGEQPKIVSWWLVEHWLVVCTWRIYIVADPVGWMRQQICLNGSGVVRRFKILTCAADSLSFNGRGNPRLVILPIQSEKLLYITTL